MNYTKFLLLAACLFLLAGCSRPKAGICSTCPVWFFDPICLSGGDVPDPAPAKPKTPPPVETDIVPGSSGAEYHK